VGRYRGRLGEGRSSKMGKGGGGGGGGEVEHRVALIVKNADPSEVFQIFLLKQTRPRNEIAGGEKDSDIWDLASVPLLRTAAAGKVGGGCDETLEEERLAKAIGNVEFNLDCLGLKGFAISDAVEKVSVSCLLVCAHCTALHCTADYVSSATSFLRCSVCDPAKIFLTSKVYGYFLFSNPTHQTKTGTANKWETTYSNPPGPINLSSQSTTGVRPCCGFLPVSANGAKMNVGPKPILMSQIWLFFIYFFICRITYWAALVELLLLRLLSLWGWAACLLQIQTCIHPTGGPCKSWRYWKYVEEPAYGPGPAVHTVVFIIEILRNDASFSGRFSAPFFEIHPG